MESRETDADRHWEAAWEARKYEVGRAMHEGWKRQKIANGFADHTFTGDQENWPCNVPTCRLPDYRHHPDMIPWDDLPAEQQAINFEGGREGFRLGFLAGAVSTPRNCANARVGARADHSQ